jgi:hypothetical protein
MKIPETPVIQVPSTWPTDLRVREYPRSTVKPMAEAER